MEYGLPGGTGNDSDLPPSHRSRFTTGGRGFIRRKSMVLGNGRLPQRHCEMETEIHQIEQQAYTSVLRAFKAQSDAITWEKEGLITELRKELRVSDEEHRELLSRVNADDIIKMIRQWREATDPHMPSGSQPAQDHLTHSPPVSTSYKKQKTFQSVASMSLGAPSPTWHTFQQSSFTLKGRFSGARGKVQKLVESAGSPVNFAGNGPSGAEKFGQLIGRKVWTRWPEDNNFYEAVISDYNSIEGRHALVYDINTPNEAWEWVNLDEISPEDIRWEGQHHGIILGTGRCGSGHGFKKSMLRSAAVAGKGRGLIKVECKADFPSTRNSSGRKSFGDIEILHTDTLIKEVEKVITENHPDAAEIEKAKKVLKDHEQALVDAITKLEDASDGESGNN